MNEATQVVAHPIYINCFFFDKKNDWVVYIYKIETSPSSHLPFQLFKRSTGMPLAWQKLSVYASVYDAIQVLVKELLPKRQFGNAHKSEVSVSPQPILDRLNRGERYVSVFNSIDNVLFRVRDDVFFEELIDRSNTINKDDHKNKCVE